jgi:preprotein translocase subunit SecG
MIGYILVAALHVLVCVILILVVLLQSGKGADLASAFGGSSTQTVFGSRGPASFLSKLTTIAAVVFMLTSLGLSLMGTKRESKSIMDTSRPAATKAAEPAPAQPNKGPALTPQQLKQMQEELQRKAAQQSAAPASTPAAPAPATAQPAGGTAAPEKAPPAKK